MLDQTFITTNHTLQSILQATSSQNQTTTDDQTTSMCNMHPALIVIPYVLELIVLCVWLTVIVIVHFTKVYRDAYDTVTIHHKVHNTNVEKQKKDFEIGRQTNFLKGGTVEADPKEVPVDELPELSPAGTSLRYASTMKVPSITQSIQQSLRAPSVYKLIEADDPGA